MKRQGNTFLYHMGIIILVLGAFWGCKWGYGRFINVTSLKNVRSIVLKYEEALRQSAEEELKSGGAAQDISLPGIKEVMYLTHDNGSPIVMYETGYSGFASQTSYYGFYYSPENRPLGFCGEELSLPEEVIAFQYEMEGDNWYGTEKITDNWFYYEMHY